MTVHYPWHPLHGQTLVCVRRAAGQQQGLLVCERPEQPDGHIGIPWWMTDAALCAAMSAGPPMVDVAALGELRELLDALKAEERGEAAAPETA